jgi:hypothetical protein
VLSPADGNAEESIAALISEAADKLSRKETTDKTVYCLSRAKKTRKAKGPGWVNISHKPSPQHRQRSISMSIKRPRLSRMSFRCDALGLTFNEPFTEMPLLMNLSIEVIRRLHKIYGSVIEIAKMKPTIGSSKLHRPRPILVQVVWKVKQSPFLNILSA